MPCNSQMPLTTTSASQRLQLQPTNINMHRTHWRGPKKSADGSVTVETVGENVVREADGLTSLLMEGTK